MATPPLFRPVGVALVIWAFAASRLVAAPQLPDLPDLHSPEDQVVRVPFTVTPPGGVTVTVGSSNPSLVPDENLLLEGAARDRTIVITPRPDAHGSTVITLTADDDRGAASVSFTLTIEPVNDPPAITALADASLAEDSVGGPYAFAVSDVDSPVDALTATASSSNPAVVHPNGLTVEGTGPDWTVTVQPLLDAFGTASVTVTVRDDQGAWASASFTVVVMPVNDPPAIAQLASVAINEDTETPPIDLAISDPDHDVAGLTVTAASSRPELVPPSRLRLGGSGGQRTLVVTPAPDRHGTARITVTVGDGLASTSAEFVLAVLPVPDPPTITAIPNQQVGEGTATAPIPFTVGDPDNDVSDPAAGLTVTATSSNSAVVPSEGLQLDGSGPARTITVTPAANAPGSSLITVTVSDGDLSAAAVFTLLVDPVNDTPTISPIADQTTTEDSPSGPIAFTIGDPDDPVAALVVTAIASDAALVSPSGIVLGGSGSSRTLTLIPVPNGVGTTTITVSVSDGSATATESFDLAVQPVEDPPRFLTTVGPQQTPEDTPTDVVSVSIEDVDTSAAALTLSASSTNAGVVAASGVTFGGSGASRTVQVTPVADVSGTTTIVLTLSDGALTASTSFSLTVTPVDDPPFIGVIPDQQTPEDTPTAPIPFTIGDVDDPTGARAQALTLSGSSSNLALVPNGAIVFGGSGVNRTVRLTPEPGQIGAAVITVTVTDATGRSADRQFALTVSDVPCQFTVTASSPLGVAADGGTVTLSVATSPKSCAWTASVGSSAPWLTVLAPTTLVFGDGGASIAVAANPGTSSRSGTIQIGSSLVTITQAAAACSFEAAVDPPLFPAAGGPGTLIVTTAPGCPWTVSAVPAWITLDRAPVPGPDKLPFHVTPHAGTELRTATLTVAGRAVTVLQSLPATSTDGDGDGLPDLWEAQFGIDPRSVRLDDSPAGDPDGDGGTNLEEYRDGTHPRGFATRLLAEGATGDFFDTTVALANPDAAITARVLLRFLRPDATWSSEFVVVPPMSRRTVAVDAVPGLAATAFSTTVESDAAIVVDRTMTWDASGYGAHSESSTPAPQTTWYFAEGATHSGFDLFYLLQNPSPTESAAVRVTYLRPSPLPRLVKMYDLPPGSRTNVWVDVEEFSVPGEPTLALANTDVSAVIEVVRGPAIAAERAMYLSRPGRVFVAGHASAGIAQPATNWLLAEGATGPFFDEFVLVANPNATPARVAATFLLPDGRAITQEYEVAANSRFNIWLDVAEIPPGSGRFPLADTAVSTVVRSTNAVPVIVERAMWWPGTAAGWTEAHNAAGTIETGTRWAIADGEIGGPRHASTYVLIANPGTSAAQVNVTLLLENGTVERTYTVPASTRFNVDVAFEFAASLAAGEAAPHRFGVLVESVGSGPAAPAPIVVERATYWDSGGEFWAAGANAIATRLR